MLSNPELRNTKQDIESIHVHPNVQLLPESCGVHVASRNLGGFPVEPHEYPWMALIAYRTSEYQVLVIVSNGLLAY